MVILFCLLVWLAKYLLAGAFICVVAHVLFEDMRYGDLEDVFIQVGLWPILVLGLLTCPDIE
jgi:hypothetical protein